MGLRHPLDDVEALIKTAESEQNVPIEFSETEIFIREFRLIHGPSIIPNIVLWSLFKNWSKNPGATTKKKFLKEIGKVFKHGRNDGVNGFKIDRSHLNLHKLCFLYAKAEERKDKKKEELSRKLRLSRARKNGQPPEQS